MNIVQAAADLVWSPVLRKFPDLKIALSEGGIGWIPYFLERIDYNYRRHHAWTGQDFGDKLPSEVFNDRILTCFIDDRFGMASREFLNLDHVMWECDYPHSDSTWPFAPEELVGHFDGVSDAVIDKVTHLNAMEQFSYDPFATLGGREQLHRGGPAGPGRGSRREHEVGGPGQGRGPRGEGHRPLRAEHLSRSLYTGRRSRPFSPRWARPGPRRPRRRRRPRGSTR